MSSLQILFLAPIPKINRCFHSDKTLVLKVSKIFQKQLPGGVTWEKKLFEKILHNSQENSCVRASFSVRLQAIDRNFMKKRRQNRSFTVSFRNFSELAFSNNTCERLPLKLIAK